MSDVSTGTPIRVGLDGRVLMQYEMRGFARYAVELVRATRPNEPLAPDFVKKYVNFGASVRAAQFLVLASKARALIHSRYHVSYADIRAVAAPILRHRVLLNFHAESERLDADAILKKILDWKPEPK